MISLKCRYVVAAIAVTVFVTGPVRAAILYAVGPWSDTEPANLYQVNPSTAAATLIGSTALNDVTGIAFAPDGTLYGTTTDALYKIDTITAAATQIGLLGIDVAGRRPGVSAGNGNAV